MKTNIIALCLASLSALNSASSSFAAEPATPPYVEFLDPSEKFKRPAPTKIALGELLAEADFIAVVYTIDAFSTQDCEGEVLRLKRLCAKREDWSTPGMLAPHVLRNAEGDEFLLAVSRRGADIFTHGEGYDHDAYNGSVISSLVPYLYFGKVRTVTPEQAEALQKSGHSGALDGGRVIPLAFSNITQNTPVRAVQGLRGIYPLYSMAKMIEVEKETGFSDAPEQGLRQYAFKYLIQTYTNPDVSPLVKGVNRLIEALAKEKPQARQSLGALAKDEDPVTAAAANYLLALEKLPRFQFNQPVPLPVAD